MNALEILIDVRELLSNPNKWALGVLATDAIGQACKPLDDESCCWCLAGAILACCKAGGEFEEAESCLTPYTGKSLVEFNDSHTHQEVLKALDKAISKLEKTNA